MQVREVVSPIPVEGHDVIHMDGSEAESWRDGPMAECAESVLAGVQFRGKLSGSAV